jgi:hypothetical protein
MGVIGFLRVSLGSSTVQLHDCSGSRLAYAYSEADFSSQNGNRAWRVYYRRAAFFVSIFCWQKDSIQRIFLKKLFLFMVGSVCRVKGLTTGSRNSLKYVRNSRIMLDQAWKWLRLQSKDFYAEDKYINFGGGHFHSNRISNTCKNPHFSLKSLHKLNEQNHVFYSKQI